MLRNNNSKRNENAPAPSRMQPPSMPPRRELHEHAAEVAQQIIDLQDRVSYYQRNAEEWERQAHTYDVEIGQLKRRLSDEIDDIKRRMHEDSEEHKRRLGAVTERMEYFQLRWIETKTRLNDAAQIILNCMDEDAKAKARNARATPPTAEPPPIVNLDHMEKVMKGGEEPQPAAGDKPEADDVKLPTFLTEKQPPAAP